MHDSLRADCSLCSGSAATAAQMLTDTSFRCGTKQRVGTSYVCSRLLGMYVVCFLLLVVIHATVGGQRQRTIAYTSRESVVRGRPECVNMLCVVSESI